MTTVREFTSKMWYEQKIAVIKWKEFDKCNDVNGMFVDSYGVMDDTLIIEVH